MLNESRRINPNDVSNISMGDLDGSFMLEPLNNNNNDSFMVDQSHYIENFSKKREL